MEILVLVGDMARKKRKHRKKDGHNTPQATPKCTCPRDTTASHPQVKYGLTSHLPEASPSLTMRRARQECSSRGTSTCMLSSVHKIASSWFTCFCVPKPAEVHSGSMQRLGVQVHGAPVLSPSVPRGHRDLSRPWFNSALGRNPILCLHVLCVFLKFIDFMGGDRF